jgi:hypothetical protein
MLQSSAALTVLSAITGTHSISSELSVRHTVEACMSLVAVLHLIHTLHLVSYTALRPCYVMGSTAEYSTAAAACLKANPHMLVQSVSTLHIAYERRQDSMLQLTRTTRS